MCPPGVDQTQRSPQCWTILVPRLQQQCSFSSRGIPPFKSQSPRGTLFQAGGRGKVWDAWSKLARPPRAAQHDSPQRYTAPHSRARFSAIESIPAEILSLVLNAPSLSKSDIVAFGLASPTLWPHALRQIAHDCRDSAASWAGAEIANIGTYLTKLPPQFEKDSLLASSVGPVGTFGNMCTARRLNYAALSKFKIVGESPQPQWRRAFYSQWVPGAYPCEVEFLATLFPAPCGALSKAWVLRNLTTKEYVRCRFDNGKQQAFVETEALPITIEDALMLRICWTTSCYNRQGRDFSLGAWAGHAFDIVLADDEIPTMECEAWMEVTDEIVKEAKKEHGLWQKQEEIRKERVKGSLLAQEEREEKKSRSMDK